MKELPFNIPKSLVSYLEQYENDSNKTVKRLEKQLKKRGPDPVGYFILGWFYYLQGSSKKAIDCALKAKTLAPGSPFFKKLHYFFSHPNLFDAWHEPAVYSGAATSNTNEQSIPVLNLDSLIEKLSQIDATRIGSNSEFSPNDYKKQHDPDDVDDIASETLAKVHEQQGNNDAAIVAYQKLKKIKKEKAPYYNEKIIELEKIKAREQEE